MRKITQLVKSISWRLIGGECCIVPYLFSFGIAKATYFCKDELVENITPEDYGPIHVVAILDPMRALLKLQQDGCGTRWGCAAS